MDQLRVMKNILYALLLLCFAATSCSDDSTSGSIVAYTDGLFVDDFGQSASTYFTRSNVGAVSIASVPEGWSAVVSMVSQTVTVTAPATDENGEETSGSVVLSGDTSDGTTVYEIITVRILEYVELDDEQANSMVVSKPGTFYSFNPNLRGENTTEELLKASSCKLLWRTSNKPIDYVQMVDGGRIGFFVNIDENDVDDDGDETDLIEGNAVIAALASNGTIMWSWHIWITEKEISSVNINGVEFMDRNIGAFMNSNAYVDEDFEEEDSILASYGLYYQWGRKDPFIYPSNYNAAGNYPAGVSDGTTTGIKFEYYDSTSTTGSITYTTLYPRYYITATSDSNYDWIYSGSYPSLWGDGGEKSIYDPSPKGWRVPSMSDYEAIDDPVGIYGEAEDYGAELNGELWMALGRRVYMDASIQNYAPGVKFKPWAGHYWSREVAADGADGGRMGASFHFYLDEDTNEVKIDRSASYYRSTGMQIRPVRM